MTRRTTQGKILFVHYNAESIGSARQRILTLVSHLAQTNDVLVILPVEGTLGPLLRAGGIRVEHLAFHDNKNLLSYFFHGMRFARFCRKEKIRLIHILDHVWWKPVELIVARLLRIPFVSMVTFNRPEDAKAGALRWANAIVANSKATAEDFVAAGLASKTFVIHNAVNIQQYSDSGNIREELFPDSDYLLGFVGVLHPIKGIDVLLKALAQIRRVIPHCHLVIVGPEKFPGEEDKLRDLCQQLGLNHMVRFLGYRADVPEVMASFDCLIVPSLHEPFGYVCIEAGAVGTPVIASKVGGIPEIIRDGVDGYLVPASEPDILAERILHILSHPPLREQLGRNFQERVAKLFSEPVMLEHWDTLYRRMNW